LALEADLKLSHVLPFAALSLTLIDTPTFADSIFPDHPASAGMVNDFAEALSPNQRASLETELRNLKHDTKAEVAVVTVTSLHGMQIGEYSIELGRRWGISAHGNPHDKVGNGVLFLIAPSLHKARIEVGTRLEPILTDLKSHEILHQHYHPHFLSGAHDVAGAIVDTTHEIDRTLRQDLTPEENKAILSHQKKPEHYAGLVLLLTSIVGGCFILGVWSFFNRRKPSPGRLAPQAPSQDYSPAFREPTVIGGGVGSTSSTRRESPYTPPSATESDDSFGTGLATGVVLGALIDHDDDQNTHTSDAEDETPPEEEADEQPSGGSSFGDADDDDNTGDFGGGGASEED
jgi:uncharacterized membrane protein YgcG